MPTHARESVSFLSARDAAAFYIKLGWYPIPLRPGTKECKDSDWKDRSEPYTADEFEPNDNVGLRLVGAHDPKPNKIVGIDLDCKEAVAAATDFLPASQAMWGRKSKVISQVLYTSPFERPVIYKDLCVTDEKQKNVIVEIRVDHQSMCPPSKHPEGEQLRWLHDKLEATAVDPKLLKRATQLVATAAMVARYYAAPGARHDWCLALSGTLRQLGLTEVETDRVLAVAGRQAGEGKARDRAMEVKTTYARDEDDPTVGARRLAELIPKVGKDFIATLRKIWLNGTAFALDDHGKKILANQENIKRALERLEVKLAHDVFSHRLLVTQGKITVVLDDIIMDRLWLTIEKKFGFRPTRDYFDIVVSDLARSSAFHPVRDYLSALVWDGKPRIDTWLTDYGKAVDTPLVRACSSLVLKAAVRRVMVPGCKFDELLVLESEQGKLKSTALRTLCPNEEWFSDDLPLGVDSKQVIERTVGKWIVEAAELSGIRRANVEHLKSLLSRQIDGPARMAYARQPIERPRQFVVIGTTNSHTYLKDGENRRFWPVRIQAFDAARLKDDRDQIWAEAYRRERAGEAIRLPPELYAAAAEEQDVRRYEDEWELALMRRFPVDKKWRVTTDDLWDAIGVRLADRDEGANERLHRVLQRLGFRKMVVRPKGGKSVVRGWGRNQTSGVLLADYSEEHEEEEGL